MRYLLRTLMIVLAIAAPVFACLVCIIEPTLPQLKRSKNAAAELRHLLLSASALEFK